MTKTKTYPSTVLVERLRAAGFETRCLWEVAGPKGTAWLSCYLVQREMSRGPDAVLLPVLVQTFDGAREGWEAWVPAHSGVEIEKTVQAVIAQAEASASEREGNAAAQGG
jgi:hypothetical protein